MKFPRVHDVFGSGHSVNDGLWHSVTIDTRDQQISLTLDDEAASAIEPWQQLEAQGDFYLGGQPVVQTPPSADEVHYVTMLILALPFLRNRKN